MQGAGMTTDVSGKRLAFLMYPEFEELDLIGPWEMAAMWSAPDYVRRLSAKQG